jgi:membrane protein DedA with SNARE-associated domain
VNVTLQFVLEHGYSFLFAATFANQIGIPLPGPLLLLAAGALAAAQKMEFAGLFALTITACLLADWVWYEAGRRRGDRILHFIHSLTSRDPDYHDRKAKGVFARYGPPLLLVSKFVPGLDTVAPPLAGTSGTSRARFLLFDGLGAALYACVYGGLGYVFSHDLDRACAYVSRAGKVLLGVGFLGICVYYTIHKLVQRYRAGRNARTSQIAPADIIPIANPLVKPLGVLGVQQDSDLADRESAAIARC